MKDINKLHIRLTEIDDLRRSKKATLKRHQRELSKLKAEEERLKFNTLCDLYGGGIYGVFTAKYKHSVVMMARQGGKNHFLSKIKEHNWSGGQMRVPNV